MYHFISGYTAKVAGTEQGVTEPTATFSACFGAAFLVWHPNKYAQMLAEKMDQHAADAWLINTGWIGGAFGTGQRIPLGYTRAIIDAIHGGHLEQVEMIQDDFFGLAIPQECPGVPQEVLQPRLAWSDQDSYQETALHLAKLFDQNFHQYREGASDGIAEGGPSLTVS